MRTFSPRKINFASRRFIGILSVVISISLLATGIRPAQTTVIAQQSHDTIESTDSIETTFSNTSPITINDNTTATPSPSMINVAGVSGFVTRMTVRLNGLTHQFPDDIDIMLVGPTANAIIMSDVGGSSSVTAPGVTITIDDRGATGMPDTSVLTSGTFKATNIGTGDTFPGAPTPSGATSLNVFSGASPNGQWNLYVLDDQIGGAGSIAGGWSIDFSTGTFNGNSNNVQILNGTSPPNPATIYPSTLTVAGNTGSVTKVRVRMTNYTHNRPDDVDVMVVGPQGQNVILMSDCGGTTDIGKAVVLYFDDESPIFLPDNSLISGGTYKPTNFGGGDTFASPAPAPQLGTSLSVFNGTNPNGVWQLFIVDDDATSSTGAMSTGWALEISTNNTSVTQDLSDFDGDGRDDVAVFRPSNGTWYLQQSSLGFTGIPFGQNGDVPAPGDYDGDGKTDIAVFRPSTGVFYLLRSQLGFTFMAFGLSGDVPVCGDFDGDGKSDIAVFRPSAATFYVQRSQLGFVGTTFGLSNDLPAVGDYDGDRVADIAVFRPSTGSFYLLRSTTGYISVPFGTNGDKPVPGDYDGDGLADVAVFRQSTGSWYLLRSQAGFTGIAFGADGDKPAPEDYDGDGKTDIAVFRPSTGAWYILRSQVGFFATTFGTNGDIPSAGAYIP